MNLNKLILTKNTCYKRNVERADARYTTFQSRGPKGIMVHSTGANNPNLKRYVGPDDGKLGKNIFGNHWNVSGLDVCVHAFIGKLKDGAVATYQTLPWNYRGWHAGSGDNGSANNTHIGFEICEDNLKDATYFAKVYKEAVELCVYLCNEYGLTEKDIIDHREGCAQGIASNHGDVAHWFNRHGKSMDTFRADVKSLLNPAPVEKPVEIVHVQCTGVARGFDKSIAGTYTAVASGGLNVRHAAGSTYKKMCTIPYGTKVKCYGYYTTAANGRKWYLIQFTYEGIKYTGFASSGYLRK